MGTAYVPVRQDAKKMKYIEWLTTPPQYREPATEKELAAELDVYPKTLYNWKHEREFREVWSDQADQIVGGEDKRQRIMETLYMAAIDYRSPRHVQAAKLYLEAIGAMQPQRLSLEVSPKALGLLSDEELEMLIAKGAAELNREEQIRGTGGLPTEEHPG